MQTRRKLLIVEADTARTQAMRNYMQATDTGPTFDIYQTTSTAGARAYAGQIAFDVVLAALALPDSPPTAVYTTLADIMPNDTAIILISDGEQAQTAQTAVQQGAADYLLYAELNATTLPRVVDTALARRHFRNRQPADAPVASAQKKLAQRIDQLELQNEALMQFNATMAHQVQGILSQIIGYGSLIELDQDSTLSTESQRSLRRVLQSAHKINNVTNELMLLSSLRRRHVEIMPVDMQRVLNEVFKRLRFQMEDDNGRVKRPSRWPVALGHPAWLEEVWFNYISNGLKYGGDPPRLHLGADRLDDNMIRFWVKDNGRGITPEDKKRLFKPHSRLQEPRARGQGLGLAIVQRIIKKSGGTVGVDSTPGAGSTFWFTLPAADSETQPLNAPDE